MLGDDYEIRRFSMKECHDDFGARVYAAAAAPSDERQPWTVYHRPERGALFPVKLLHVDTFEQALELCRALVKTYTTLDSFTSAHREGAPVGGQDGSERAQAVPDGVEGRARKA